MTKKNSKLDGFESEYKNISELMENIHEGIMVFPRDIELHNRADDSDNDRLYLVYEMGELKNTHFGERTLAYMQNKKSKKLSKVDQDKLRNELGEILIKQFDKEAFFDDFTMTLTPMELIEAYDRAVVKSGKVKHVEGCSKFLIYGQKGSPMELMLRN